MMRLLSNAVLTLVAIAGLSGQLQAQATSGSPPKNDPAAAARMRDEIRQMQITYAGIGLGVVGVVVFIFVCLSGANKRGKELANAHKRKRPLDPDAPLDYIEPGPETPPTGG